MAQRYAVSYFGNRFGSVICNQRSFTSGREVTSFSVKICCPDGFPHHSPTVGNVVGNKCRTPVYGGIWLSKPSGAQAPDFRSTNSVNLNDGYKFDRNTDADSSSVPYTTFNFKNAICNKSTIYAGLYTPLNDTVNSVLAYVGDSDITLYYTQIDSLVTWSSHGLYFGSFNTKDPYDAPTFKVNSYTKIGRVGETNYNVNYTINKGSDNIEALNICLLDYHKSSWSTKWEKSLSRNSSGTFNDTYQLTLGNGFTNGNRYSMKMYLYDGTTEILRPGSGFKTSDAATIYTYQQPTIGSSVTIAKNPQNANTSNSFTISGTNNRKWTSYEEAFQTHYRIKRGNAEYTSWSNLGNVSSWTRSASQIRSLIPKAYDADPIIIQFRRYSPSANWYSGNAQGTFYVYYRPKTGISSATYRRNNSSGSTISTNSWLIDDDNLTGVYIAWNYDTTIANAGYTQGYRVRLYNSAGTLVKTYYTANKYYNIPKADIPRLQQTYIDITPYYQNDSTNTANYWYYNGDITRLNFIKIQGNLAKPVIEYPVNNSNWINSEFRIAFKLPSDPDKSAVSGTYRYRALQIQINNQIFNIAEDSSIFNKTINNLGYQEAVVCCPYNSNQLTISTNYSIKVRVQKNYGTYQWSSWSDTKNIKITSIQIPSYTNQIILASHYNYMRDTITRMINTYAVSWPNDPKAASKGIIIDKDRYSYSNVLNRLTEIKNKINNYADFDNIENKFDSNNQLPTSFTVKEEIITDQEIESNGANYLITILNRCKLLQ